MTTRKTAYPDASTAIAISTQMVEAINAVEGAILGLGDPAKSRDVAAELLPLIDTAQIIGLRAVALSIGAAQTLATELQAGRVKEQGGHQALSLGLTAIVAYLQAIAGGKIHSGFALYVPTAEMQRYVGREPLLRQEFFLPVMPVYGPNSPTYNEGRFIAEVARYLSDFRQEVKRYETRRDVSTVNEMRKALVTMETKNPPANFRMLLSLSILLMDITIRSGGNISRENEPLIARIDRELTGVVNGELDADEGTISWLMYVIGQSSQFSARIRAFQESYELVRLVEESQAATVDNQTIEAVRTALDNAQRSWESASVSGGDASAAKAACFALAAVANSLGDYSIKTMAMALGALSDGIFEGRIKIDHEISVFGASIFVAIVDRLGRLSVDPRGGRSVADHQRDRVRMVLNGKRPSELPNEFTDEAGGDDSHVAAFLAELSNDLGSAEQIIDQCLRDGAKEPKREEAARLFSIVHAALLFLNMNKAAEYSLKVSAHVDRCITKLLVGEVIGSDEQRILADSVLMLHRYVSIVALDQGQADQELARGQALFLNLDQSEDLVDAGDEGPFDVCNDEELGPIFFEEAKQFIDDIIKPGIKKLRDNSADESTMLDVRRGFHTLKGSARMVELENLGFVGQHAEYVLNIFRDNRNLKITAELLDWLDEAANFFHSAVLVLENGKPAKVDSSPFEAVYNNLRDTNIFKGPASLAGATVQEAGEVEDLDSLAVNDLAVHIPETGAVIMPLGDVNRPTVEEEAPVITETIIGFEATSSSTESVVVVASSDAMDVVEDLDGHATSTSEDMTAVGALDDAAATSHSLAVQSNLQLTDDVSDGADVSVSPEMSIEFVATQEQEAEVQGSATKVEVPAMEANLIEVIKPLDDGGNEPAPDLAAKYVDEAYAQVSHVVQADQVDQVDLVEEPAIAIIPEFASATENVAISEDHTIAEISPLTILENETSGDSQQASPAIDEQAQIALAAEIADTLPMEREATLTDELVTGREVDSVHWASLAGKSTAPPLPPLPPVLDLPEISQPLELIAESIPLSVVEPLPPALTSAQPVTETTPDSNGEVMVGDVSIPSVLFATFNTEAGVYVESLQHSINDLVSGKRDNVDFEIVRLAHSIAGMGRTTGLTAVTHLSGALEDWGTANQDRQLHITPEAAATLLDAMEALSAMIMGVRDYVEPVVEDRIVARLEQVISADERRIAMVEDLRQDVPQSQLDELQNSDVSVGDAGVVETIQRIQVTAEAAAGNNTPTVTEVAKAPEPFRLLSQTEGGGKEEAGVEQSSAELDQGLQGCDLVTNGASSLQKELVQRVYVDHLGNSTKSSDANPISATEIVAEPADVQQKACVDEVRTLLAQPAVALVSDDARTLDWLAIVASKEDDVDPEMFEIFGEEADERFGEIDEAINALQGNVTDKRTTNLLKRAVHTLKGSANTAGCRKIGVIFHHLEDLMDEVGVLNAQTLAVLQSGVDAAFAGLAAMRSGRSVESAVKRSVAAIVRQAGCVQTEGTVAEIAESSIIESSVKVDGIGMEERQSTTSVLGERTELVNVQSIPGTTTLKSEPRVTTATAAARPLGGNRKAKTDEDDESSLRVSGRQLDKMVKAVGEINITRSRVSMNVGATKSALNGLAVSLEQMYGYLRQVEFEAERQMSAGTQNTANRDSAFDALQMDRFTRLQELTRRVAEAQNDVMTQQGSAVGAVRDMEDALAGQYVLVSELSDDLDQIRQVRVSSIVPQLKRVVRAACRDTGKLSEIYFDADVEIDRGILSKVMGSLEHILRNAVAHGIEPADARERAGKDVTGTIEFRAYQDGGEVVIEIRDDGHGMDTTKIYDSAVRKGVIKAGVQLSSGQIRDLIFEPGFSTASEVTDIAGRGVGLDVVRSAISAMGGRVQVESTVGTGTVFVLRVPATLTVISGAAVSTNSHMYVVPVSFIDRLVRISGKDLEGAYRSRKLIIQDAGGNKLEYEFWGMWEIGGAKAWDNTPRQRNSILLMRNDRVAVHVDDIRPAGEFVFRPLGPQIIANSGLIGSTIGSNGNAALVVDPSRVARLLRSSTGSTSMGTPRQKQAPLVLVVDDSTTVRKVTTRLLIKEGFRCAEAENGMKALEMLQKDMPAVILMDIEMPLMNGYEATQAIRATPSTASIPIIMITSRAGDSHRQKAMDLGVNEYLGKPYNESDLMEFIHKYTADNAVLAVV